MTRLAQSEYRLSIYHIQNFKGDAELWRAHNALGLRLGVVKEATTM